MNLEACHERHCTYSSLGEISMQQLTDREKSILRTMSKAREEDRGHGPADEGHCRLLAFHEDAMGVLEKLSSTLYGHHVNIHGLWNKGDDITAFTLIEIRKDQISAEEEAILRDLNLIEGMLCEVEIFS